MHVWVKVASLASFALRIALLLVVLTLAGCGGAKPPLPPVDAAILAAIVETIRKKRGWIFSTATGNVQPARRKDRHRGFFVYRRASWLGQHMREWVDEPGQPRLIARVETELDMLENYLDRKIGSRKAPGPLGGGTDPVDPPHLDLSDVARPQTNTRQAVIDDNLATYRNLRRARVQTIIYRAAALHGELWAAATEAAALREVPFDGVLDRRLRAVERMSFNIGNPSSLGQSGRKWRGVDDADGPWLDGFRVRMIEYPRLSPPATFINAIGANNIAEPGADTTGKTWRWSQTRRRLEYVGTSLGAYFPPPIRPDIDNAGAYTIPIKPRAGRTAAAVIEDMFTPNTDFWGRTWFWCDHCIAAVNIEALRFALRRRNHNDDEFNSILTDHSSDYVAVGAFISSSANHLQTADDDRYFDNIKELAVEELEVGDQLIFWNSFVYGRISEGDWRLENAYVMEVDSNPNGTIELPRLELQGHGTMQKTYHDYQNNEILPHLKEGLSDTRAAVEKAVAADPSVVRVRWKSADDRLVKWSPYEESPGTGAWWIKIGISDPHYVKQWNSVEDAKAAMPKTLSNLDPAARGVGYHPPPALDAVYFPLWEPRGGWEAYLKKRATDASLPPPVLQVTKVTGDILPGLYKRGANQPIPVIKPEIR